MKEQCGTAYFTNTREKRLCEITTEFGQNFLSYLSRHGWVEIVDQDEFESLKSSLDWTVVNEKELLTEADLAATIAPLVVETKPEPEPAKSGPVVFLKNPQTGEKQCTTATEIAQSALDEGWQVIPEEEFMDMEEEAAKSAKLKRDARGGKAIKVLILTGIGFAILFLVSLYLAKIDQHRAATPVPETFHPAENLDELNSQLAELRTQLLTITNKIEALNQRALTQDERRAIIKKFEALEKGLAAAKDESANLRKWATAHNEWANKDLFEPLVRSGAIRTE